MQRSSQTSMTYLALTYVFVFVTWFLYRYGIHFSVPVDELIAKPILWMSPVVLISVLKKISFNELRFKKIPFLVLVISVGVGIGLAVLQLLPNYLQKHASVSIPSNIGMLAIVTMGTAISEEVLFRGFFFKELNTYYSSIFSNVVTSILFATIHIPILFFVHQITGTSLLVVLYLIFASGISFGLLYTYTDNLWSPIIAHFILNILLLIF